MRHQKGVLYARTRYAWMAESDMRIFCTGRSGVDFTVLDGKYAPPVRFEGSPPLGRK